MARGLSSYTDSTITLITGGTYTGDGTNGWSGGTTYQFAVQGRRTPLNRPGEDTTDSGYKSQAPGPIGFHVELTGFFKNLTGQSGTPTIPPIGIVESFVKVVVTIGFSLTAVIHVTGFDPVGRIGQALGYTLTGDTDGTFTYA